MSHQGCCTSVLMPSRLRMNEIARATLASSHHTEGWLLMTAVEISMVAAIAAHAPDVMASWRSELDCKTLERLSFIAHDHERMMTDVPEIARSTSDFSGGCFSIRWTTACTPARLTRSQARLRANWPGAAQRARRANMTCVRRIHADAGDPLRTHGSGAARAPAST